VQALGNLGKPVARHGDIHPNPKQLKQFLEGCVRFFMARLRNECPSTELQHSIYATRVRLRAKYCKNYTQHPNSPTTNFRSFANRPANTVLRFRVKALDVFGEVAKI